MWLNKKSTFLSSGRGRGSLYHCVLERYHLLSDFKRCDFQDNTLSVIRHIRHLNRVGAHGDY